MNVLVQLLYSLRQGFLTFFHGLLRESGETYWPLLTNMYLNTQITQTGYISSITIYIIDCTTKETNYAQMQFSKY